jgi:hypothetical protein
MEPATPEEAFRYCLENPDSMSTEQLLDKFPMFRGELESLLAVHSQLAQSLPQSMPAASREAIRGRLTASVTSGTAAGNGAAAPSEPQVPGQQTVQPVRTAALPGKRPRIFLRRRLVWAISTAVALVLIITYLSSTALPDSPLYGLKLATESQLLNFSNGPESLASGHVELANSRLRDLRAMQSEGKLALVQPAVDNYATHLRSGVSIWEGLTGESHNRLDKSLYLASVIGANTFEGLDSVIDKLPAGVKGQIGEILLDISDLNAKTGTELRAQGIDTNQLLNEADASVKVLLTPLPGVVAQEPTPLTTSTVLTATPVPAFNPVARVQDPHSPGVTYFPSVGHTLRGVFRDYWERHGGLEQFGYPLTEEFPEVSSADGKTYTVQYFERARFEHHPENKPPYDVQIGLLGSEVLRARGLLP